MSATTIATRTYLGLFAFTLAAQGLWYALSDLPVFADNDGFMRALRVEALWQGGNWFDRSIPRVNAPYGDTYHWTRPLDMVISLLALPLVPFLGAKPAIFWGTALSGPVLHGATVVALAWAALPLVGRAAALLAAIAATAQYGLVAYGSLVRGDHHILYAFLAALGSGLAIRALDRTRAADRNAALAGVVAAAGVWVGVEALVFAAACLAAFGLAWLAGEEPLDAPRGFRFAAGFAAGLAAALALELGPSFRTVEYHQISMVHATLGVLLALFFSTVRMAAARGYLQTPPARFSAALAGAVVTVGVWVLLFPKALRGPTADYDPEYVRLLIENLGELQSGATLDRFPATLGATVLALPWLAWRLGREKTGRWFWAWAYVGMCVAIYGALTAGWVRWAIYTGLFPCLVLGDMIARITERIAAAKVAPLLREAASAAVVAFFLLGPPAAAVLAGIAVAPPEKKTERLRASACSVGVLAETLNRPPWSDRPRVILTGINYVGEILYRTAHHGVGMSYRTERFWRDILDIFAARDDAVVGEIIARRHVELIAICPGGGNEGLSPASRMAGGFYDRLRRGSPPAWIREVALPVEAAKFRLFEVNLEARGR